MRNKSKKTSKSIARVSLLLSFIAAFLTGYTFYKTYNLAKSTPSSDGQVNTYAQYNDSLVNSHKEISDKVKKLSEEVSILSSRYATKNMREDIVQDSIKEAMDSLCKRIDSAQNEIDNLKEENKSKKDEPKKALGYLFVGVIISIALALIGIFIRKRGINNNVFNEVVNQHFDNSPIIRKMQVDINNLLSNQRQNVDNIEARFKILEKWKSDIENGLLVKHKSEPTYNIQKHQKESKTSKDTFIRMGYARINSERFFTDILESNQEACVFAITFKSENEGNFTIISLDKIRSRNGWQDVVEYNGSIENATSFKVEEQGVCKKINENTWEVVQKLKIKLI